MSCDDNSYYLDFWPLVSQVWKHRIGYEPVLIHIGENRNISDEFGEVIHSEPIKGYPIHTQAQLARLWYPQKELNTVWITSDIDMFPISRTYWKNIPLNGFDWCNLNTDMQNYFPICYNIASGENFKKILSAPDNFGDFLAMVTSTHTSSLTHKPENWNRESMSSWSIDEVFLSSMVCSHRDSGGVVLQSLRPGGRQSARRLDRVDWNPNISLIQNDWYIDCHSLRPLHHYSTEIKKIMDALL